MVSAKILLPKQCAVDFSVADNRIRQVLRPEGYEQLDFHPKRIGNQDDLVATLPGSQQILFVRRPIPLDAFAGDILRIFAPTLDRSTLENGDLRSEWLKIAGMQSPITMSGQAALQVPFVLDTWRDQFSYRLENQATHEEGLRPPQLGALFAVLAHWTISVEDPATIAMPTGTGKTETMLALLVNQCLPRLLVVVPNSALRTQIADKFLTLGMLRRAGVIGQSAQFPLVGLIKHRFPDEDTAKMFFRSCNVIVATMQAITGCTEEVRRKISELCSHLSLTKRITSTLQPGTVFAGVFTANRSCNSPQHLFARTVSISAAR